MRNKADIQIGGRMYEEVMAMYGSAAKASRALKCSRARVYEWKAGNTPGALFLSRLVYLGGDVEYVLTGRKRRNA